MTKTAEFFFDVGSPASYLAWTQMPALCARAGAMLVVKAVTRARKPPAQKTFSSRMQTPAVGPARRWRGSGGPLWKSRPV